MLYQISDVYEIRLRERSTRLVHGGYLHHRMPESLRAFCKMVSFTAANTKRIFVVSVAWVRLEKELVCY